MSTLPDPSSVKIYTVNGAASGSSSSLPDWLTRKRAANAKGKRAIREHVEGTIELIQHFEFPEASNRIKTTRDGHHAVATGTYKPQMKVWDLDQLSLKFERHSEAENVDFIMLSDDWTKSIHLQNDRTIELHTQGGLHYRTRIPHFGRALAYHFPTCDALFGASGAEVYRLNLDQGRFLNPLVLQSPGEDDVPGVNAIDINPAHQLFAFGVEGNGTVQFWDPRSRARVGVLRLPRERLLPVSSSTQTMPGVGGEPSPSVTAISSRLDGLSYAIGTSSGHTLLYDIRAARHLALKDQGYGLPIKKVIWIEGGSRMAGDGLVLSADKKVIKIWDRNSPDTNFASITPAYDLNDVHHVPGSGLLMIANEAIQMTTYYIPQLGPAPQWCSFLENITEELEDQTTRTAYQDYKFVERSELATLGLDHLVGTPALKPYMHGYFLSLALYDAARVIANPYVYAEHRERVVREKMEKMAESRIRARADPGVRVNKALAEKIRKEGERERRREERRVAKRARAAEDAEHVDVDAMVIDEGVEEGNGVDVNEKPTLLSDPRFKALFEDAEFQVDESSREYALMNPSAVAQRKNGDASTNRGRTKTAVEEEEEESDKMSSDGLGESSSQSESEEDKKEESEDSDAADELWHDDIRARMAARTSSRAQARSRQPQQRQPNVRMVPLRAKSDVASARADKDATFGQRRFTGGVDAKRKGRAPPRDTQLRHSADGGMEMSFIPKASSHHADDDILDDDHDNGMKQRVKGTARRKGVETFGAGMERGGREEQEMSESERKGRTHRRKGMRSGSKNTFRRM
ncbi:Ribosome biogenesis protein enp2 homolog [Sparassis crispa]|uniref:Ribosome biogenesis protein enp2 homolog n=1 Tax=Sparassis crispa TaxID=139825 RepID=A0A401GZ19_9APHY|nr:Ribosome biogenesis protein enp2 homolog [Sparassis crispa]GBE87402.1 Ribosome biogenesis protein enp2 homolog [Sparassis crispa]